MDWRRDDRRRHPRQVAVAQPSPEPQGPVVAPRQGGRCTRRRPSRRNPQTRSVEITASAASTPSTTESLSTPQTLLFLQSIPRNLAPTGQTGHVPETGGHLRRNTHQLIGEVRQPIPAEPGQPLRYDYEYKRNGTANLFVFLDAHRSWRKVKVTERRMAQDFAQCMRDLVDIHYPQAERIRLVLDNLSTHTAAALYQSMPPQEARRILQRIEFWPCPWNPYPIAESRIGLLGLSRMPVLLEPHRADVRQRGVQPGAVVPEYP